MLVAFLGLLYLLAFVCGIASLVFFIMVVMQMFKRDQTNLGIICIVLTLCTGVGPLIAFIFGWIKATEWNLKKIMTYWTVAMLLQIVIVPMLLIVSIQRVGATIDQEQFEQEQFEIDPNNLNFEFEIEESEFNSPEFEMPDDLPQPKAGSANQP